MEFTFKHLGKEYKGRVVYGKYLHGNNLYIGIEYLVPEHNYYEMWCDLSTNLNCHNMPDMIFVRQDEQTNYEKKLTDILKDLGIITGMVFMDIPYNYILLDLFKVNLNKLKEYGTELK